MQEDIFQLGIKGLIRNSKGEILLLKVNPAKLRKPTDPYWDIPGGRIQRGSTIEETLKREIEEEIGVSNISNIKPYTMVVSNIRIPVDESDTGLVLGVYTCDIDESAEIKISDEHLEYKWFSPIEASELLKVKYPVEITDKLKELV